MQSLTKQTTSLLALGNTAKVVWEDSALWGFILRWQRLVLNEALGAYRVTPRRRELQRLFSTFPAGWPGLGLLLLRATVGVTAVVQGFGYLAGKSALTPDAWVVGLLTVVTGLSVVIGFLTPVTGAGIVIGIVGVALSWIPAPTLNVLDARVASVFAAIVSLAIIFLGPGAYSVDSRLFGRREIIIPPSSHSINS